MRLTTVTCHSESRAKAAECTRDRPAYLVRFQKYPRERSHNWTFFTGFLQTVSARAKLPITMQWHSCVLLGLLLVAKWPTSKEITNIYILFLIFSSETIVWLVKLLRLWCLMGTRASYARDQHPKQHMLIFSSGLHIKLQYLLGNSLAL